MSMVRRLLLVSVALIGAATAHAQLGGSDAIPDARDLIQVSAAPVTLPSGERGVAVVTLRVREGWHVNANPPSLDYMIPTDLSLTPAGGITVGKPVYPAARDQKLSFEAKPLKVYDHAFEVRLPLIAVAGTAPGKVTLKGTVGFQACNDQVCLAPASVPFELVVTVGPGAFTPGSAAQGAAPGPVPGAATQAAPGEAATTPAPGADAAPGMPVPGSGYVTAPPPPGAGVGGVAVGGILWFALVFLGGLGLNLTPCVFPMLGVTVSIFGARKAAPPAQVLGLALVYVLGMAAMYTTLGVVAGLTGGMFGAALQNPIVLFTIGALLVALSYSMFGLYELQPPTWLLEKAGGAGTTSAVGIFLSGLAMGVIAAPCIGAPVLALLAVVGAKGDPWFGFSAFFTLSMGLGAPYLVLATFSNLIQRLPRSGDWMVWVKKVFGVIMISYGTWYIALAIAPRVAKGILPATLITGGIYLGFIGRTAGAKPAFRRLRWAVGVLGVLGGIALIAPRPSKGIPFEAFDEQALAATLEGGRPAILDFTADWCAACHELERYTFSDPRVKEATRVFRAFRVDLTGYQSPDAERWRQRFAVNGLPTVVFLSPDGNEVHSARVVGFIPPAVFLERVETALAATRQASR